MDSPLEAGAGEVPLLRRVGVLLGGEGIAQESDHHYVPKEGPKDLEPFEADNTKHAIFTVSITFS